jgi:hypothetical protein
MGTRADFYLGRGPKAEWLGSIAWDGYPGGIPNKVLNSWTDDEFRERVAEFSATRKDWTSPEQGWPWPWENSATTDYAYAFEDDGVWVSRFGRVWVRADQPEPSEYDENDNEIPDFWPKGNPAELFPDMTELMNVTWGKRSGLIVVGQNSKGQMSIVDEE